uniref:Uncharacterized protein n=1 Tax=Aegilops tauschii subsp. strangulata TaxID=200361 RepID=A0A453CBL3_AEGTS
MMADISMEGRDDTGVGNCQKSKLKAKMNAEVQAEKARAKNSLTKRLPTLNHKVEGKQA